MTKYILLVLIIFNISQCIFMLDKYYLPESLCNHNISCIAIGDEVEYNGKSQPEISLLTEDTFWYFPDTDRQNVMRGWTQTPAKGTASFRRIFFNDQTECDIYNRNSSDIREFILINFQNNELVYDIYNPFEKDLTVSAYSLLAHPVFNESKIQNETKIDAVYNAYPNIVIFQGENYFVIHLNYTEDCQTQPQHFGPFRLSEIESNVVWTHVTSAVFDKKTLSLYIFQSDQVLIYHPALMDNRGKYLSLTLQESGHITELFFNCQKPPDIDLPTEQNIGDDSETASDSAASEESQSPEHPESETSSENDMVSANTTDVGKKKSIVPIIIIFIIVGFILALLVCCLCVFCITKTKKSSEDKESGLTEQTHSGKAKKPDSSENIERFRETPIIPLIPSKTKTESEEKITPNVLDIDKDKTEIVYQDIENMQIRTPDEDDYVPTEGNADVLNLPPNEDKADEPESVKPEPSETENKDTDKEKITQDSVTPSPDQLWSYPSSAKSTDSETKSADSQPKPTDSSDHSVKKPETEEFKSGSLETSVGSLEDQKSVQSIGSIDSSESLNKNKPKTDPNSKEFKKPEDSGSSDSPKPPDTTPKDKSEPSNSELNRTHSEESLTDDTEIF